MGYIMPVDRYQYIQYQERLSNDRLSLSPVNSIASTKEITNDFNRKESLTSQQLSTMNRGISNPDIVERTYAEITGSGRHFSETI